MGDLVAFLNEAARYFEGRDTGGEDKAHWANVANAENCRKAADDIEKLRRERDEARGWAKDWHNIVDLTCTVIGLGVLDAPEVVEAVRDKFDQAERRATAAEAKVTEMREALRQQRTWHEEQDKAITKQPNANVGQSGWMRCQHQEQIDAIDRALQPGDVSQIGSGALAAREGADD